MSNGRGVLQADGGGGNIRVRLRSEDSEGELAVIEEVLGGRLRRPAAARAPVVRGGLLRPRGRTRFPDGERDGLGCPGTFVFAPRGLPHTFANLSGSRARALIYLRARGLRALFRVACRATGGRRAAPRAAGGGPVYSGGWPADRRRVGPLAHHSAFPKERLLYGNLGPSRRKAERDLPSAYLPPDQHPQSDGRDRGRGPGDRKHAGGEYDPLRDR
jgi:hypothetical protein